jgi:uncharacterized protein (DUF3820 family)
MPGPRTRGSRRLPVPTMPFGKYRRKRLSDVARDLRYVHWLLSQSWFERRYPALFARFHSDPLLLRIRDVEEQSMRATEARARQLRAARDSMQQAREARWEQERIEQHVVDYRPRGIWPFGKYKGQPLFNVARDEAYCRWFKRTLYAKANPSLAADLKAMVEKISASNNVMTAVELSDGGCTLDRAAVCSE